jgi:hypothetical protein
VTVGRIVIEDLDWVVERLAQRRAALASHAPVYWRPAASAAHAHRRYLGYVLSKGGGVGFRTGNALLIAAPEATVAGSSMTPSFLTASGTGPGSCYGMRSAETIEQIRPPAERHDLRVKGATASLVPAPRIYDPGGPVLFLTEIGDFCAGVASRPRRSAAARQPSGGRGPAT